MPSTKSPTPWTIPEPDRTSCPLLDANGEVVAIFIREADREHVLRCLAMFREHEICRDDETHGQETAKSG